MVTIKSLDFVRVLDIDDGSGNVTDRFRDYSPAANLAALTRAVRNTSFLRDTADAEIARAAGHPGRAACTTRLGTF